MRLEQLSRNRQHTALGVGAEPRIAQVEVEPFQRQVEFINPQVEAVNRERQHNIEEDQAQYPWEDFGGDLDSIVDTYCNNDEEEDWDSDDAACGDEGCYLDGVYYNFDTKTVR